MIIASQLFLAAALTGQAIDTSPVACSAIVPAPIKDVWNAYTSTEGIKSWMVAEGTVDLRLGGLIRTSYKKGSDLKGPDVIENKIISLDPEHMLTMQCVRTPATFPFKEALMKLWTVLYFEPANGKQTKVTCRMLGFDETKDSQQCRNFFKSGNQSELDELVKHFKK